VKVVVSMKNDTSRNARSTIGVISKDGGFLFTFTFAMVVWF